MNIGTKYNVIQNTPTFDQCVNGAGRPSEINQVVQELDLAIAALSQSVASISDKVAIVLRQEPACGSGSDKETSSGYSCSLASELKNRISLIKNAANTLQDLNSRVEL